MTPIWVEEEIEEVESKVEEVEVKLEDLPEEKQYSRGRSNHGGLWAVLCNHVFNYGNKASSDKMSTIW